jgi:hypothetical protein
MSRVVRPPEEEALFRSEPYWSVLETMQKHVYDYDSKGSRPDSPGWHTCRGCSWEGYWSGFQPHVAEEVIRSLGQHPSQL